MLKEKWLKELAFAYVGENGEGTSQKDFYDDGSDDDGLSIEEAIKGQAVDESEDEDYEEDSEDLEEEEDSEDEEDSEEEETEETSVDEIEIDGEKLTKDQIREMKKMGMLQSDYTKKTTELANQRKQMANELELVKRIENDPQLIAIMSEYFQKSGQPNSVQPITKESTYNNGLAEKMFLLEGEIIVSKMKNEDPIFANSKTGEAEIYQIALEKNIDLQTAKVLWEGMNKNLYFKDEKDIVKKTKKEIAEKQKKNKGKTRTLVSKGDKSNKDKTVRLSAKQSKIASMFGMSDEEYAKYNSSSDYI